MLVSKMLPMTDESVDDGSKKRLNSSTSTDNSRCSVPELVGGHGPWQYRHWITFLLASACNSMYLFSVFPISSAPVCACSNATVSVATGQSNVDSNCTSSLCHPEALPEQRKTTIDQCVRHLETSFISDQETSDCSNINLIIYAKCIYVLGILISGLTIRLLMFKFGRRAIALTSSLILLASAIAIGWSQNQATFLILRLIISIGVVNVHLLSAFSLMEVIGDEFRLVYGLIGHLGWGMAHFLLPLVVWLTQNWIQYSMALSTVTVFLGIALCFIPDSIEAFLSKGLMTRAHKIIRKAAWSNGCSTQDIDQLTQNFSSQTMQEEMKTTSKNECIHICFQLALLFFVGFSASFLYFTSIWLVEWVNVNRGTYFALAGTTEIASAIILLFMTCFFSLKHLWSVSTIASSVSLIILYAKSNNGPKIFSTFPYLINMFFASAAWTILVYRALFHPIDSLQAKRNSIIICIAVCIGILAATATDFQKFYSWNPKLYVIYGIPNLTVGAIIGFMPNRYFKF